MWCLRVENIFILESESLRGGGDLGDLLDLFPQGCGNQSPEKLGRNQQGHMTSF